MLTQMPACAFCRQERELCSSHSIPDGFFKAISRHNNGQLISIPRNEGSIHLSQNTGQSKLLCKGCESHFNRNYDASLVNAFKAWDKKIQNEGFGVYYEFSANHLAQSLTSVFWRASVSGNDLYENATINVRDRTKLFIHLSR